MYDAKEQDMDMKKPSEAEGNGGCENLDGVEKVAAREVGSFIRWFRC